MIATLALAVVHSLWQGVVAFGAVTAADALVGGDRAATRHAVRVLALAALVIAFGVRVLAPGATASAPVAAPAWVLVVAAAWCLGAGLFGTVAAVAWVRIWRWRTTSRPVAAAVQKVADEIASALSITAVAVREHAAVAGPCVVGALRPMILLPLSWAGRVPPDVLRIALVHELVHVRRRDPWVAIVVVVGRVVLFHHPVAWWLAGQIEREREFACDAEAAAHCGGRLPYGRGLLALEGLRAPAGGWAPAATHGALAERVARLVGRRIRRPRPARRWLLVVGLLAATAWPLATPREDAPPAVDVAWLPDDVRRHDAAIVAAAQRHGVDARLLAIIVLVESGGNPRATSPVGARGLMQMMPRTAADLAHDRGLPAPNPELLYDPQVSLDLGAAYLARQLAAFADPQLAVAAYNAGPARVRAWQRGEASLPPETRQYRAIVDQLWAERDLPWSLTLAQRG